MAVKSILSPTHAQNKPQSPGDLLKTPQAAKFLGLSANTLSRWRAIGVGPAYVQLNGRTIRYRTIDLENYVLGQQINFESEPNGKEEGIPGNLKNI